MWTAPDNEWRLATRLATACLAAVALASPALGQVEIGDNDLQVDDRSQSRTPLAPDVAFNPLANEYFVVWSDEVSPGKTEIFGQRLDGAGQRVGPDNIPISSTGGDEDHDAFQPAVAFDAVHGKYLVAWRADDPDFAGLVDNAFEVIAVRVDADGTVSSPERRISESYSFGERDVDGPRRPAVVAAESKGRFLVAWSSDSLADGQIRGEDEIFVFEISSLLFKPLGSVRRISTMDGLGTTLGQAHDPALAYDPVRDVYLVVWTGTLPGQNGIFGQLLTHDPGLQETGFDDFAIGGNDTAFLVDAAYGRDVETFQVVWTAIDSARGVESNGGEIFGRRLGFDGDKLVNLDRDDVQLSDVRDDLGANAETLDEAALFPRVAYVGPTRQFFVTWEAEDTDSGTAEFEREAFGQVIDGSTGLEVGINDIRLSDMGRPDAPIPSVFHARSPAVTDGAGGELLVVWSGREELSSSTVKGVFGQRVHLGAIFTDGFESGDTSPWSLAAP